ncbi:uncharacterized protein EKO05_0000964 [Ascochyta rabiei]|nr:uncharacterized protein EKO05_0000964 [Ascochyta rabiei]UPX10297.1 hypothetical protein EKO05_0000964 [Ascochyta rabiei]
MLLQEEDSEAFKRWVLPKLETISDADAEVLADYVLALVTAKDTDANIRRNCLESLSDFLQHNTAAFVDEVIDTLKDRAYAPRANADASPPSPAPIPSIVGPSTSEHLAHPSHASNTAPLHAPRGPAASRVSHGKHRLPDRPAGASPAASAQHERPRKRKQHERDTSQSRDGLDLHSSRHTGNDRPAKQATRRGKNGRAGGLNAQAPAFAPMPNMPPFSPAFGHVPPFDPGNPMAFLAMAAALGINLPGMPPMPVFNAQGADTSNVRCADYDTKGFCAAGTVCPYQHGLEYDPDHPAQGVNGGHSNQYGHARRDRGHSGRSRAAFSLPGPTHDRTNTTIVVEQIPEDNFSEDHVRRFFGKFGTLLDVQMQAYKRLAVVKYETHDAARAAYNSPKAIFDNRFVKVYWHRSDADRDPYNRSASGADSEEAGYGDTETLDPEEIERRQAEAQRIFEERRRKAEEAEAKAEEIDRKLQETNAEILRVRRELAKASGNANGELEEDFSQDLATLQAEAENLFAQQDAATEPWRGSSRGGTYRGSYRGSYRGRGQAFAPRGRGRGAYRGRGAHGAAFGGARMGVKRLDNRPRRIAVKAVEPGSRKDEALRQHLFNVPDIVSTDQHPEQPHTLILTFAERYQADSFIDTAHQIPDVGKLDMEWVSNDALGGIKTADADADANTNTNTNAEPDALNSDAESAATVDGPDKRTVAAEDPVGAPDADMDVAEDEDQWL